MTIPTSERPPIYAWVVTTKEGRMPLTHKCIMRIDSIHLTEKAARRIGDELFMRLVRMMTGNDNGNAYIVDATWREGELAQYPICRSISADDMWIAVVLERRAVGTLA